jgi:hypothetical protein
MWNSWKIGQNVRVTFTDKGFEPGQSLDCQIAGIMRKNGLERLLFNTPQISPFFASEDEIKFHEWEYVCSDGVILALVSENTGVQWTAEWKATVEPLSDREPC